jgi:predicted Zn-dependent protease
MRQAIRGCAAVLMVAILVVPLRADDAPSARLLAASRLQDAGDHKAAIELLEQMREIEPENQQVVYGLAVSLHAIGDYREAAHVGSTLLAEHKEAPADLHVIVGSSYGRLGDWEKAEATFRDALVVWPGHQALSVQHAISMEALGRVDEAVAELEACLRRDPYNPALWRALGDALSLVGAPGRAFAAYVRSLTLEEDTRAKARPRASGRSCSRARPGRRRRTRRRKRAKGLALLAALGEDVGGSRTRGSRTLDTRPPRVGPHAVNRRTVLGAFVLTSTKAPG